MSTSNTFDLIFVLKDQPEESRDEALAEHVLLLHSKERNPVPPIPPDLFKKLILYAREHVTPKLSGVAIQKLKDFYVRMRQSAQKYQSDFLEVHPVPITPRHLEALVRLTEAHARMLLKDVADESDAEFAIQLMTESLQQVAYDVEAQVIDASSIYTGETFSRRSRYMFVLDVIKQLLPQYPDGVPVEEVVKRCEAKGLSKEFVMQVINKEKLNGTLFERRPGKILFT